MENENTIEYNLYHEVYESKLHFGPTKEEREAYRLDRDRLTEQFKQDAFIALNIVNNPKREKLYKIAYDRGHSNGLYEVYMEMTEMLDLIK